MKKLYQRRRAAATAATWILSEETGRRRGRDVDLIRGDGVAADVRSRPARARRSCSEDNSTCVCDIPGSQRGGTGENSNSNLARDDYVDAVRARGSESSCNYRDAKNREGRSWHLKGYELTVYIEEMSSNSGGYWRSVTGCSVKTEEVLEMTMPDTFYQRIRLRGTPKPKPYKWFTMEHGLPWLFIGVAVACIFAARTVRCARDEPCPTCGRKLIFGKQQCLLCQLYGAEMPDPVLLARIRARRPFVQRPRGNHLFFAYERARARRFRRNVSARPFEAARPVETFRRPVASPHRSRARASSRTPPINTRKTSGGSGAT